MPRPQIGEHRQHIILSERHKVALREIAEEEGTTESDVLRRLILVAHRSLKKEKRREN